MADWIAYLQGRSQTPLGGAATGQQKPWEAALQLCFALWAVLRALYILLAYFFTSLCAAYSAVLTILGLGFSDQWYQKQRERVCLGKKMHGTSMVRTRHGAGAGVAGGGRGERSGGVE